jgi:hypothetical protein
MNSDFRDPNYNPMMGAGRTGRVQKDEFSIDGKSWNYRDPYNQEQIRRQNLGNEKENDTINEHSSTMTNPLYDYSYGQTRDAAKALGIGNVDEQAEVDQLIGYMQNGPAKEDEEAPVEKIKADKPKEEEPAAPVAPSQEVTAAKERVKAYDPQSFGAYGPKKSAFAQRSTDIYNPNQDFQANQQTSVSSDRNEQAQSFILDKLNKTKKDFNFQPTL